MRASGLRNERVVLLRPTRATDKFGAESIVYEATLTVHAERVKMSGTLRGEVGERFPSYAVEYNVRYPIEVEEHWRLLAVGGYLYEVASVVPNRDRQMKTLVCERVNE